MRSKSMEKKKKGLKPSRLFMTPNAAYNTIKPLEFVYNTSQIRTH